MSHMMRVYTDKIHMNRPALKFLDFLADGEAKTPSEIIAHVKQFGDHFVTRLSTYLYDLEKYYDAKIERVYEGRRVVSYKLADARCGGLLKAQDRVEQYRCVAVLRACCAR